MILVRAGESPSRPKKAAADTLSAIPNDDPSVLGCADKGPGGVDMRRIFILVAVLAALSMPSAVSAAVPTPDPAAANCHGLAMGIGASRFKGVATFARQAGISVIDAHFVFMDMQNCPE